VRKRLCLRGSARCLRTCFDNRAWAAGLGGKNERAGRARKRYIFRPAWASADDCEHAPASFQLEAGGRTAAAASRPATQAALALSAQNPVTPFSFATTYVLQLIVVCPSFQWTSCSCWYRRAGWILEGLVFDPGCGAGVADFAGLCRSLPMEGNYLPCFQWVWKIS
jgi:hypothetical protein